MANRGWGDAAATAPLYVQEGDLVTERSVQRGRSTGGS